MNKLFRECPDLLGSCKQFQVVHLSSSHSFQHFQQHKLAKFCLCPFILALGKVLYSLLPHEVLHTIEKWQKLNFKKLHVTLRSDHPIGIIAPFLIFHLPISADKLLSQKIHQKLSRFSIPTFYIGIKGERSIFYQQKLEKGTVNHEI